MGEELMNDMLITAENVFDIEIEGLRQVKECLGETFSQIVDVVAKCEGKVVLCGMGKSGHIAKKISATLASLGTPSFFLHPAEAQHGDLGMVTEREVVILISHSGESEEIVRLLPSLRLIGATLIAITSNQKSTLAQECEIVQLMPPIKEACALNLAPTSSTTAVLVYGDALAVAVSQRHSFSESDFALFHPAGALGKKILIRVADIMAQGDEIPLVEEKCPISDAIVEMSRKTLGVVTIVNKDGRLVGLLTDGDLRRALEKKVDMYGDIIDTIMTKNPQSITALPGSAADGVVQQHLGTGGIHCGGRLILPGIQHLGGSLVSVFTLDPNTLSHAVFVSGGIPGGLCGSIILHFLAVI